MRRFLFVACAFVLGAVSAAAEPVTLRFGAPAPARAHLNVQVFGPWAEKVTAESQGTLKIEFVPGGVLGTEGQLLERVSSGVVDIAYDLQSYYPGRFPKSEVVTLPFLFEKSEHASLALWRLFEKNVIADEYKGIKALGVYVFPNAVFMSTAPIKQISELKGKKMQASTKLRTNEALAVGAIPVSVPIFDLYQALGRGTVTIAMQQWTAVQPFRLHEVTSHYIEVPLGGSVGVFFVNQAAFDKLPPQAKKAILDNSGEGFVRNFGRFWDRINDEGRKLALSKSGQTLHTPSAEELAEWRKTLSPVRETWLRDTKGGTEILKEFVEELARVGK